MMKGKLHYNSSNDRYGIMVKNSWADNGLHCGEAMEAFVKGKWVPCRIELDWTDHGKYWYLVGTPYYGDLGGVSVRR